MNNVTPLIVKAWQNYYALTSSSGDQNRESHSFTETVYQFTTWLNGKEKYKITYYDEKTKKFLTKSERGLLEHIIFLNNKIADAKEILSSE